MRRVHRWKTFGAAGCGPSEPLLITPDRFRAFVGWHVPLAHEGLALTGPSSLLPLTPEIVTTKSSTISCVVRPGEALFHQLQIGYDEESIRIVIV